MLKERKDEIVKFLRPVLTAIEYAIAILVIAVSTELTFGDKLTTWLYTLISIALSVFTSIIWLPSGVEMAERTQKVFNTTLRYNTYANYIVNNQLFDEVRSFCLWRNDEFEKELLTHKLGEYLLKLDNLNKYVELKKNALKTAKIKPNGKVLEYTDKEFLEYRSSFEKKQIDILEYYSSNKIKFEHLIADDLLKGHKTKSHLKPINNEGKSVANRYVSKIIWGVVLGVFTASFIFTKKSWSINETIQVLTWGFSILLNIYTSINAGFKSVNIDRYNYYKEKNERCVEFFKYVQIKVQDVEADIRDQLMTK